MTLSEKNELVAAVALQRVASRRVDQAMYRASVVERVTQDAIAAVVGVSQAQVNRRLKRLRNTPSLLDPTPIDAINQRAAGVLDTDEMMHQLRTWDYTFGSVASVDGSATDSYRPGSWDDVEMAYQQRLLSDAEMQDLLDIHADAIAASAPQ